MAVTSRAIPMSRRSPNKSARWIDESVRSPPILEVWHVAVIKPNRYKPRVIRAAQSQLLDREQEFFVLIALLRAMLRLEKQAMKTSASSVIARSDFHSPVLARPQVGRISPHRDSSCFERSLQLVYFVRVLPHV